MGGHRDSREWVLPGAPAVSGCGARVRREELSGQRLEGAIESWIGRKKAMASIT